MNNKHDKRNVVCQNRILGLVHHKITFKSVGGRGGGDNTCGLLHVTKKINRSNKKN